MELVAIGRRIYLSGNTGMGAGSKRSLNAHGAFHFVPTRSVLYCVVWPLGVYACVSRSVAKMVKERAHAFSAFSIVEII